MVKGTMLVACFLVSPAVSSAAPADGQRALVIDTADDRKAYDCHGGSAVVNGGDNRLTFRNCRAITVNGGDNVIDAGVVESIAVHGASNKVTWTEAADGKRPKISDEGLDNVISSKRAEGAPPETPTPSKPPGGKGARSEPASPPAPPQGRPAGSCEKIDGVWAVTGTCGPDLCVITLDGCLAQLKCGGGAVSYAGAVSGTTVTFTGETAAGEKATCKGTAKGNTFSGTCILEEDARPCTFNATKS